MSLNGFMGIWALILALVVFIAGFPCTGTVIAIPLGYVASALFKWEAMVQGPGRDSFHHDER